MALSLSNCVCVNITDQVILQVPLCCPLFHFSHVGHGSLCNFHLSAVGTRTAHTVNSELGGEALQPPKLCKQTHIALIILILIPSIELLSHCLPTINFKSSPVSISQTVFILINYFPDVWPCFRTYNLYLGHAGMESISLV